MKHLKTLGLVAAAATALMAFGVGTASATTLENGTSPYSHPIVLDLSLVDTFSFMSTSGSTLQTCTGSTIEGETTTGSATTTVQMTITKANWTWSGCVSTTDTVNGGILEIHHIAGTSNGRVTGAGFEITTNAFGTSCTYGLGGKPVDFGELQGSGHTPILDIRTVITEQTEDKFLCPNDVIWDGAYHVTVPTGLTVTAG